MKKYTLFLLVLSFIISGCQPAASPPPATQTPDPNQCTDRGWDDIAGYLYQFDDIVNGEEMKTNSSAALAQLGEIKSKVSETAIDICTENARGWVIKGLENRITGMEFMAAGDNDSAYNYLHYGIRWIISARGDLAKLGIHLNYPKQ